jgi:hypothetical protein
MIWFGGAVAAAATVTAESAPGAAADALTASIEQRVNAATEPLLTPGLALPSATAYRDRVRTEIWTEVWPDAAGKAETRTVTGELWTATIQASLDQHKAVFLPGRAAPYYLDRPIVLSSGCRLLADPRAEIRLKPGTSTCMVRNEHVAGFQDRPVPADLQPDTDILIQGCIWTTLATMPGQDNGNARGRADSTDSVPGCHGVILLQNVQRAVIRILQRYLAPEETTRAAPRPGSPTIRRTTRVNPGADGDSNHGRAHSNPHRRRAGSRGDALRHRQQGRRAGRRRLRAGRQRAGHGDDHSGARRLGLGEECRE